MTTRRLEFKLVSHNIAHFTKNNKKIRTRALKVQSNFNDKEDVLKELMVCLKKGERGPNLALMSNTGNFKFIPFGNKIFTKDQVTSLIKKQNNFLHNTHAILVVNLNLVDGIFKQKDLLKNKKHGVLRKRKVGFAITIGENEKNKNNENKKPEYEK